MKKILLYIVDFIFISRQEKQRNFYGFGEIKLDTVFKNVSSARNFKKLSKGEFQIDTFKLSEEIGVVKNLKVKIKNEKIYDVSFDCTETTDVHFIDLSMEKLTELKSLNNVENESLPVQFYQQSDGNVIFSKIIEKKASLITYRYCDIRKIL